MKSREKSVGFWSMLGGLKKTDDGAGIEKPRPVRFWAEAHLSTQFPKEEKHRTETIVLVEYTGERERERDRWPTTPPRYRSRLRPLVVSRSIII